MLQNSGFLGRGSRFGVFHRIFATNLGSAAIDRAIDWLVLLLPYLCGNRVCEGPLAVGKKFDTLLGFETISMSGQRE